jgi:hypothetical protein
MSRANPRFHRINVPLPSLVGATAFELQVTGFIDNQIWIFGMQYIWTGGAVPNANAELNLGNNWATNCVTSLRGIIASDVQINQVKVSCLTIPARLPVYTSGGGLPAFGSVAGNHIPSEMAGIVSRYTNFKGQHGRGRFYVPGVPISFVTPAGDANRINALGVSAYSVFVANIVTPISDGTNNYSLAVIQRTRGGAAATNGAAATQAFGRSLLGTVRRRRVGRGK